MDDLSEKRIGKFMHRFQALINAEQSCTKLQDAEIVYATLDVLLQLDASADWSKFVDEALMEVAGQYDFAITE